MKPPGFWAKPAPDALALALAPLGLIYGALTARRMAREGDRAPCPVICVGNFTLGGAGKTPTAIWLARRLLARGRKPFFLSRGYGARVEAPVRVEPGRHSAGEVGDEPLLLARVAPTIVTPDRPAGALLAARSGADVVIMDDGLQNPSLTKDLTLAVVDGASGFGNGLPFPAGPLRAPVERQVPFAQAVLIIGEGPTPPGLGPLPILRGRLVPDAAVAARLTGRTVIALAGIGQPQKFVATLEALGARVAGEVLTGDHQRFAEAELAEAARLATLHDAPIVTTEKDAARMGAPPPAIADRLVVLPVTLEILEGMDVLDALLDRLPGMAQRA